MYFKQETIKTHVCTQQIIDRPFNTVFNKLYTGRKKKTPKFFEL